MVIDKIGKNLVWDSSLAYAIGLIATDGNLSPDGRHINFTSKDIDLIKTFSTCLKLKNKIGVKNSGTNKKKVYFVIQFSDVKFYKFLQKIGLCEAKSKSISDLKIPRIYFFDFLRGCIDGDGNISSTKHPESKQRQLRLRLCSGSNSFILWIKRVIFEEIGIKTGWIYKSKDSVYILSYGKSDSVKILKKMYYTGVEHYLDRKYQIAKMFIE